MAHTALRRLAAAFPCWQMASLLLAGLALIGSACKDADSPTSPQTPPALASAAQTMAFVQVSAGGSHTCGVTANHRAYCWGTNGSGALGDGTTDERLSPVAVVGGLSFRQVSAGVSFTCGVTTDDRAYCWGSNFQGQLGDGTTSHRQVPVAVAGARRFRQVQVGSSHACAITMDNLAFCWGDNASGKLGDGTMTNRLIPVRVQAGARRFTRVSVGYYHTCGVAADALGYCWGANFTGQLGDGTTTDRVTPVAIRGGRSLRQLSAGSQHTCAVTIGNAAYCWGSNRYGQIGDGTSGYASRRVRPVAVLGGRSFAAVGADGGHSCGVTTSNVAYCWGDNASGQLGDATNTKRTTPVAVAGGQRFSGLSTGYFHNCGVTTGERAYCWGANGGGRLGNGTTTDSSTPVQVAGAL